MTLLYPVWLIMLLPLAAMLILRRPPTRMLTVIRSILLVLLVISLARPAIRIPERGGVITVVCDRSESMPAGTEASEKEVINLLSAGMSPRDRLAVVSFGRRSVVERPPATGEFAGFGGDVSSDASDLAEGIESALTSIPEEAAGRILVVSDGRWTGRDPMNPTARAAARKIACDYRLLQRSTVGDTSISRIEAPELVSPGESYLVTAWLRSPADQTIRYEFKRGALAIAAGKRLVKAGLNSLMFRDAAGSPGTVIHTVSIETEGTDPVPENNSARTLVGVRGQKPILHIAPAQTSGLGDLLRADRVDVETVGPAAANLTVEELSGHSAVLLENVQANTIGPRGMEILAAWVETLGTGLMITGGRHSYGPGGYYKSPLEHIMPVSMELRKEHRKLQLAIVVTLDRSGSMACPAGGGKRKIDLANIGTAQVMDLLSDMDDFGVIAVDSSPHTIVEVGKVSDNRGLRGRILSIDSMGGGIFIYEALKSAAAMIVKSACSTKHIILFADAADSEEPGSYIDLIDKCRQAGITISVIGLGTPADCDAHLLVDIARRGGGECFFTADAAEIPRLFAQDTFTVARSTFVEEPTPLKCTGTMPTLVARTFGPPPALGGYNLCYIRPEAMQAAMTMDENAAPVVAAWHAGSGRVLCFTGEADGKYAGSFAKWNEAGAFYSSLARWTAGNLRGLPDGILPRQRIQRGSCIVELHLDPERKKDIPGGRPVVKVLRGIPGKAPESSRHPMEWGSADLLVAPIPLRGNETILATIEMAGVDPVPLPPVCLPYSPEFEPVEGATGAQTLKAIADATGGKERLDLSTMWKDLPRHRRPVEIGVWLIVFSILLVLLEVLARRTGLLSRARAARVTPTPEDPDSENSPEPQRPAEAAKKKATTQPHTEHTPLAAPSPAPAATPKAPPVESSFRQAQNRARKRMKS
ncbi:MAG: VWA domain-containing protein [bacterium]